MILEMNEKVINNLLVFLERVDLKGKEVPAYTEIVNVLLQTLEAQSKK